MWRETARAWVLLWHDFTDALWMTAACFLGKRLHGGKVVKLGPYHWAVLDRKNQP